MLPCHENGGSILQHLYVLEYAQIAQSGPKSMFHNIEGSSILYITCKNF